MYPISSQFVNTLIINIFLYSISYFFTKVGFFFLNWENKNKNLFFDVIITFYLLVIWLHHITATSQTKNPSTFPQKNLCICSFQLPKSYDLSSKNPPAFPQKNPTFL